MEGIEAGGGKSVPLEEEVQYRNQETHVSDTGDQERFLSRRGGGGPLVPEAYEQVGRYAHQFPEGVEHYYVGRQHQPQHRRGEQRHVGKVPRIARIATHVTQGIYLHHQTDTGDHHQHDGRQRVDQQSEFYDGSAHVQPLVSFKVRLAAPDNRIQCQDRQSQCRGQRDDQQDPADPGVAVQEGPND